MKCSGFRAVVSSPGHLAQSLHGVGVQQAGVDQRNGRERKEKKSSKNAMTNIFNIYIYYLIRS